MEVFKLFSTDMVYTYILQHSSVFVYFLFHLTLNNPLLSRCLPSIFFKIRQIPFNLVYTSYRIFTWDAAHPNVHHDAVVVCDQLSTETAMSETG